MPVLKYEKKKVMFIRTPSDRIVKTFIIAYGICAFVTLPETIASLQEGLVLLLLDSSGGQELYQMAKENATIRVSGVAGIYGLFSIFHNIFSDIALFMICYYLTFKDKNKNILMLLFIVFISDFLHPLSYGARTDLVMKFFTMIVAVSIFYPFYSKQLKNSVKKIFIIISTIITIPFMALTISRFGERDEGTGGAMLRYVAQAPLNFNNYALDNGGIRYGDRTFNLFKQFVGLNPPETVNDVRFKYSHHKMDDSIFSTHVGDFVLDFGPWGAVAIFIIVSSIFYSKVKIYNKTISFHSLLIVFFVACIAMHGGMYLFFYSFMRNLLIMAFIFMYLVLYVDLSHNKNKRYLVRNM
jgi:oligosaccharide repeat unit polymerase